MSRILPFFVIWALLVSSASALQGSRQKLDTARQKFSQDFNTARKKVSAALTRQQTDEKRAGDVAGYQRLTAELESFRDAGKLPTSIDVGDYQSTLMRLVQTVEGAFRTARIAAMNAKDDVRLAELTEELRQFRAQHMALALEHAGARQLLRNPGAEEGMQGSEPVGWTVVTGSFSTVAVIAPVAEGRLHFYPGPVPRGFDTLIDDGIVVLELGASVRSFDQNPGDPTHLGVRFRDEAGRELPDAYESGPIVSKAGWRRVEEAITVPAGARSATLRLTSIRQGRKTRNNDGYFDDLSLRISIEHP
jgi:hypothetical protein